MLRRSKHDRAIRKEVTRYKVIPAAIYPVASANMICKRLIGQGVDIAFKPVVMIALRAGVAACFAGIRFKGIAVVHGK